MPHIWLLALNPGGRDPIALVNRLQNGKTVANNLPENGVLAVQELVVAKHEVELAISGVFVAWVSGQTNRAFNMAESSLLKRNGRAGAALTHSAGAQVTIFRVRVSYLDQKRSRYTLCAVESKSVVEPSVNKLDDMACRLRSFCRLQFDPNFSATLYVEHHEGIGCRGDRGYENGQNQKD